ncbi:NAD(P)-dependent oxidoreductase [Methanobacterium petrolearium]|uniref:NAD(P)-dependent oxidoreductase n=1 Tax=Methanobacterium petrolearium TaxID=710190 RepID=UPI001AE5C23F|nr:DUF1932 domain-containing protein [Methanobacterium petrolearium]MBP1946591.1 3-hydroxyisobutyrate dehydrogenase-like beta-hydroxyacid dehydrogenase [Methanobacterium petrolearium]BDZ72192.1 dehydrogenase [Methanobacterium petrolearium]
MKVGFIGFGEVASTLSRGLLDQGVEVLTCVEGRSPKTVDLAKSAGVELLLTFQEVVESSDVLLSTVVPDQAVHVAKEVGKNFKGVYADLNNVSPSTVKEALSYVSPGKTTDAAMMGGIKNGLKTPIIASGPGAEIFAELNQYGMNIEVIGLEIGQASALKMLRSAYTKGVSALLFETLYAAYQMDVDEVLLGYLNQTEGPFFQESATSRIKSSAFHAKRRAQEMDEVLEFLSYYEDPLMIRAACEFFHLLPARTGIIRKKPADYREMFREVDYKGE